MKDKWDRTYKEVRWNQWKELGHELYGHVFSQVQVRIPRLDLSQTWLITGAIND